jgi:hypothetical protein
MTIENQHLPSAIRPFVCVIVKVNKIFHAKAFVRIPKRACRKKSIVFVGPNGCNCIGFVVDVVLLQKWAESQ